VKRFKVSAISFVMSHTEHVLNRRDKFQGHI